MKIDQDIPITVSVPEFGRLALGIGRDASYAAAARGDFPVVEVGALKRVPLLPALKPLIGEGVDMQPILARFRKRARPR